MTPGAETRRKEIVAKAREVASWEDYHALERCIASQTPNFHLTERFVPVGSNRIEYYATIDDPTTWTRPWTFNLPWERDDDYRILGYACHEGNIALGNSLRGERVMEAEAAKKRHGGK